jgi:acetate kinase
MSGYSLIVNAGSATYKYAVFLGKKKIATFIYQKEGEDSYAFQKNTGAKERIKKEAFENSLGDLQKKEKEIFGNIESLAFRVVHGGKTFFKPTVLTKGVLKKLAELNKLAPLHNPFALKLIKQSERLLPKKKKLLIFDTAFHHELPKINSTYALPNAMTKKLGIRKYGFHGIICSSIVSQMGWRLSKRTIICHLGSGCSVTALFKGKSVDTSMGFTPLEGLIMGTRAGDLDPGLLLDLYKRFGAGKMETMLNKESGLKGLTGTSDMREIFQRSKKGNIQAREAIEIFCLKAAKHIAAATISLGGLDSIIFSGGIGENAPQIRQKICEYLEHLNVRIHLKKNMNLKTSKKFHSFFSKVKLRSLHADEESEMNRILMAQGKN